MGYFYQSNQFYLAIAGILIPIIVRNATRGSEEGKPTDVRYINAIFCAVVEIWVIVLLLGHKLSLAALGFTVNKNHAISTHDLGFKRYKLSKLKVSPLEADDLASKTIMSELMKASTEDQRAEYCAIKIAFLKELLISNQEGTLLEKRQSVKISTNIQKRARGVQVGKI
jgi:hypothetical protein